MPIKPAAPESVAPTRKPIATGTPSRYQTSAKMTAPAMAMGGVLTGQIGLRALLDRGRDLLHARIAGIRRHHGSNGPDAIHDGQSSAHDDRQIKHMIPSLGSERRN